MTALPGGYGCFAAACSTTTDYAVTNPAKPLLAPVEACKWHLGDLLGNVVKSAMPFADPQDGVTLKVTPLL